MVGIQRTTTETDARRGEGWYAVVARSGLVAKGASYGLVGILAIRLAAGGGGKATSQQGALATLAQESFGAIVLGLLAFGFVGYVIWQAAQTFLASDENAFKEWGKRFAHLGRGLVYAGLVFSTIKILLGSGGGQSQNQKAHQTTATVLSWPGGRWIVGIAGVVIVGAGLWYAYRGFAKKFEKNWQTSGMRPAARTWGRRAGVVGHVARGVVFVLIGVFVIKAAVEYQPKNAIGLDGALRKLAAAGYGPYLLGAVAAGLVCYGVFCLVDARYRDVSTDGDAPADRKRRLRDSPSAAAG